MDSSLHRVLLNFDHYRDAYWVHFIHEDCHSRVGSRAMYIRLLTVDDLRAFILRCRPEDPSELKRDRRHWERGSMFIRLTATQYAKLL